MLTIVQDDPEFIHKVLNGDTEYESIVRELYLLDGRSAKVTALRLALMVSESIKLKDLTEENIELFLASTELHDGVPFMSSATSLHFISSSTALGVCRLASRFKKLEMLVLGWIADEPITHLSALTNLTTLKMGRNLVCAAGAAHLST